MYRTLLKDQKKPCITVLKDNKGHVFGCYTTECWKVTKDNHFYGGGEAFVFTVHPEQQVCLEATVVVRDSAAVGEGVGGRCGKGTFDSVLSCDPPPVPFHL